MALSWEDVKDWVKREANFFRIHLLFFLLVPLVSAGIFYAANGRYPVSECQAYLPSFKEACLAERLPVERVKAEAHSKLPSYLHEILRC